MFEQVKSISMYITLHRPQYVSLHNIHSDSLLIRLILWFDEIRSGPLLKARHQFRAIGQTGDLHQIICCICCFIATIMVAETIVTITITSVIVGPTFDLDNFVYCYVSY